MSATYLFAMIQSTGHQLHWATAHVVALASADNLACQGNANCCLKMLHFLLLFCSFLGSNHAHTR